MKHSNFIGLSCYAEFRIFHCVFDVYVYVSGKAATLVAYDAGGLIRVKIVMEVVLIEFQNQNQMMSLFTFC